MYTSLSIQDFRGIHTLEMNDLRRVNILTGKNNCGKTSVLEAVYLLSRSDNPAVAAHFGAYRRFDKLDEHYWWSFFYNFGKQIKIVGILQGAGEKTLAFVPLRATDSSSIEISKDWLQAIQDIEVSSESLIGLSALATYTIASTQTHIESRFSVIRKVDDGKERVEVGWNEPNVVVPPLLTTLFIHPAYLTNTARRFGLLEVRKEIGWIIKSLQYIEPTIQYIRVIDEIFYCDIGKERLLPLNVMGDGMVRLFSIILAIATTPGGVVLIDEIDTGFHYSSLEVMWKAVHEAAE